MNGDYLLNKQKTNINKNHIFDGNKYVFYEYSLPFECKTLKYKNFMAYMHEMNNF